MANMSYCRFENTLKDLRDCYEHMGDDNYNEYETKARRKMIELACKIALEYGTEVDFECE